jgi:hypothetical protein
MRGRQELDARSSIRVLVPLAAFILSPCAGVPLIFVHFSGKGT